MTNICVALDVPTYDEAVGLVNILDHDFYKVGLELYLACGPEIISFLKTRNHRVFLDLKLHDIPNTVAKASRLITRQGIDMFTVHSLGNVDMMKAAVTAAHEESIMLEIPCPKVLAVTWLTSHGDADLKRMLVNVTAEQYVGHLTSLVEGSDCDGVVCSPLETAMVKTITKPNFIIANPGVRPSGVDMHDQQRVSTPKQAQDAGASVLVVGRPITNNHFPKQALNDIIDSLKEDTADGS